MELIFRTEENQEEEVLFVPSLQSEQAILRLIKSFDYEDEEDVINRLSKENFQGKKGQMFVIHDDRQTLVIIGTGQDKKLSTEDFRNVSAYMAGYLKKYKTSKVGLLLKYVNSKLDASLVAQSLAEGLYLASYHFDKYKKQEVDKINIDIKELFIYIDNKNKTKFKAGWQLGAVMAEGATKARDLVNEPAGHMTPSFLADEARDIAKDSKNVTVKIFDKEKIEAMGMGAFLGIAQGSNQAPKFIHLVYKPSGKAKDKIALVGKGITFDSGGLNVKPWEGMLQMKIDMSGAATVLGIFRVLAKIQPKVEIHGIIAACENMSSGSAIKPGDIVTNMQGKTIEVAHTDAEGRVTLSDSLAYAQKQGVTKILDMATLTGSIIVALGPQYAGLFSLDKKMSDKIIEAAQLAGENIWQMPMVPEYKDGNESKIADIRNIGNSRLGGSITAAWFLKYFVDDSISWAHIDMAGPAYGEKEMNPYTPIGGVGFGVRTVLNWLKNM